MKSIGITLIVLAVLAMGGALMMDPSVATSMSGYGAGLPDRIVNLQKLQLQQMIWQAGIGGFVAGAVFYAVGEFIARLELSKVIAPTETAAPATGPQCEWCQQFMPSGQRTCAASSDETLRRYAPQIANPRCREELVARGLLAEDA